MKISWKRNGVWDDQKIEIRFDSLDAGEEFF